MEHLLTNKNPIDVEGRGEKPKNDDDRRGEMPKHDEDGRGEMPKLEIEIEPEITAVEVGEKPTTTQLLKEVRVVLEDVSLVMTDSDNSIMSVSSGPSTRGKDGRFWRKRPLKAVRSGQSDSDSSDKEPARKTPTAKRGRSRPHSTGQYVGLYQAKKELAEAIKTEAEAAELAQQERRASCSSLTRSGRTSASSTAEPEKDPDDCTAKELEERIQTALTNIKGVGKVSKGLKGTCQQTLKKSVTKISEAVKVLADRTISEEIVKLRAENSCLAARLADMIAVQEVLRADLTNLQLERARALPAAPAIGERQQETELDRVLSELANLNTRFSVLEGRLLRPSLGAKPPAPAPTPQTGSTQTYAAKLAAPKATPAAPTTIAPAAQLSQPVATTSAATKRTLRKGKKTNKNGPEPVPTTTTTPKATPTRPPIAPTTPAPAPNSTAGQWETVGKKKKEAKKQRKEATKAKKAAKQLRAPRSTAVVVTLQPAALERGMTYAELLKQARNAIDPSKLGITAGLRCKTTQTGARLIEVPGATSGEQADRLAEGLRKVLPAEDVRVSRPQKSAQLRIAGLDDSVDVAEVVAAVAKVGECSPDHVRCGVIRHSRAGMGTTTITCPVATAKKLAEGRRLLVGWVSAQIKLLDPRPTRCYRCLSGGHVGVKCPSSVDCSGRCFRCGQPGHTAGVCEATPHCILCAAAGKPADHRAGTKSCTAPKRKKPSSLDKSPSVSGQSANTKQVAANAVEVAETNNMDTN